MNGGKIALGGSGTTENINIHGNVWTTTGTSWLANGSTSIMHVNVFGNYTMAGDTAHAGGSSGAIYFTVNGNFAMSSGCTIANGSGSKLNLKVAGNYHASGSAIMTNTGAGCTSVVHLALPAGSGTMMIGNTSTGAWSATNVYVDTGCVAQLDDNFSTTTGAAAYGLIVNGTLICPAAFVVNGTRTFTLNGVATLEVAHATGINGAITTTGTTTFANSANYVFNGTFAQVTGSYLPASLVTPDTITIGNAAGVTLTQSTLTTGTLLFTSGILNTAAFTMSVPGTPAAVTGAGATSYVNGILIKTITGLTLVNFEVGDADYAPMLLTLSTAGTAGSLGLKSTNGLHPSVATSGLSSSNMANHYWTITNSGAAGPSTVVPKATYNAPDILGGSNAAFKTQEYSGSAWLGAALATTNTSTPYTSAPTTGISLSTLAGAYIFGNSFCGTAPITGTPSVCIGATTALADATPGGTWSSGTTAVGTISSSGVVAGISAGTTIITYSIGACAVNIIVTVNPAPTVGPITGSPDVCVGHTDALADATPGGTWSSSAPTIGSVSTAGVVTGIAAGSTVISYHLTTACGTATATVNVTVHAATSCALLTGNTQAAAEELKVFPNPSGGVFTVNLGSIADEPMQIVVSDPMGRQVKVIQATTNRDIEVELSMGSGIYIVEAKTAGNRYYRRIAVNKL